MKLYNALKRFEDFTFIEKRLTFADKTSNMYRIEKKNLIEGFKRMKFPKEVKIVDKVNVNGITNCFITMKYQKANFLNHPITTLVNTAKMKSEE